MKKNLIYTIATGNYHLIFLYFYRSLILNNCINDNLDIILITDEAGKNFLETFGNEFKNVKIFLVSKKFKYINPSHNEWKFKIFEIIDKNTYDNILYCDADCLINLDLNKIFEKCISSEKFYALQVDKYNKFYNDNKYWFYKSLTSDELLFLENNEYYNVNAGVFMFKADSEIIFNEFNRLLLEMQSLDAVVIDQAIFNSLINIGNKVKQKFIIEKLDGFVNLPPFKGKYNFILHFIHPVRDKDLNLPINKIDSMKIVFDIIKNDKI